MINRCPICNVVKVVANSGIYHTLPGDIKEADVYYDWSYKLQSCIHPQYHPTTDTTNAFICRLHYATKKLTTEDHWIINTMWSMDKGKAVYKTITSGNTTGISDGSFKKIERYHRASSKLITIYHQEYMLHMIH